ncbi:MAG: hypothetical protein L3J39_14660 [Verrucomicrobiales bacterium]|nr:hypothetical protein [Verrucomicrobiales bacterium]
MGLVKLLSAVLSVRRAEKLDAQQLMELQGLRFRKLLKYAYEHSKFYRAFYLDYGIKSADIEEIGLEDLPIIDKSIMMENYDDLVTDEALKREQIESFIETAADSRAWYKGRYKVVHTSGSSGAIGLFVYGADEWEISKALGLRATGFNHPVYRRKRIVFIAATDGLFASVSSFYNLQSFLVKLLPISISSPIEKIREQINRFKPDVITGYASGLNLLAQEQLAGNIDIAPSEAFCTGDPLTASYRKLIVDAFGVNPVNMYGSSETMTMAAECSEQHQMHLYHDWVATQVVTDDGTVSRTGKLVVTNLYNFTQPLIRYQMNDVIEMEDSPCACGSSMPLIKSIAGRTEEFLWFERSSGGRDFIHPIVLAEFFVPGLEKLQFSQTSSNALLMKAVLGGDQEQVVKAIHRRMSEILSEKGLQDDVRFEVQVVGAIDNDAKTGKFQLIKPLVRA